MAQEPQRREKFRRPELFLSELLRKSARGQFHERDENVPFLYRATVLAVDTVGGQLENEAGEGSVTHVIDGKSKSFAATVGPKNPANSIRARIISDGLDQFVADERLRTFWPFFPEHVSVPIKPGEHVYVLFEDSASEHGLWVTKVPGHEGVNFFRGEDSFSSERPSPLRDSFADTKGAGDDKTLDDDAAAGESLVTAGRLSKLDFK